MIKFQTPKYNTELENAIQHLELYVLGVETQPLKPYSIVENDASITLYKNNRKVAEFSKKNHAEARTIEKLLMMIASEYNSNHNIEDRVYLCDRSYTVYDNTYKAKVENVSDISGKTYIGDDYDAMILDDQPIKLLTDEVDFQSWYHKRLKRLNINDFNKMVKQYVNVDFIKEIKNQYGFTPDNKFFSEFIREIRIVNPLARLNDFYLSAFDDIKHYLDTDLENLIALYVTDDLKSYYYIALVDYIYDHTFECLWGELGIRGIMTVQLLEEDRQNLVNYVQKIHFDQFDHSIARLIEILTETDPEEVADRYECIQKRIYAE